MRHNIRDSLERTSKVAHQSITMNNHKSNMVKMAIDLSSSKNLNGLNTQKKQDEKPRKSCLSKKNTKIK